jgi:hypothetical protein
MIEMGQADPDVGIQPPSLPAAPPRGFGIAPARWRDARTRFLSLPRRTQVILGCRVGLGDDLPMTLDEIGLRLRVTRERVRQLERVGQTALLASLLPDARPAELTGQTARTWLAEVLGACQSTKAQVAASTVGTARRAPSAAPRVHAPCIRSGHRREIPMRLGTHLKAARTTRSSGFEARQP